MTEKLLHCPECLSENLDNSVYCCQCGSPMRKGVPARIRRSHWFLIVMISLALTLVMVSAIHLVTHRSASQSANGKQQLADQPYKPPLQQESEPQSSQPERSNKQLTSDRFLPGKKEEVSLDQLTVGNVSIITPDGFTVASFPAAVTGGSWIALPTRSCVGGSKWYFTRPGESEAIPIEGGLWGRGDAVGFWRLSGENTLPGPEFDTWQQETPVRLLSTKTGLLSEPMTPSPSRVQGAFIYSSLADNLDPGVFMQNGKVVGWSFGNVLDGAYMWTLGNDTDLLYDNYVDDFYNETFAGGREEYFTAAITTGRDLSPQRQLQMFAEGFQLAPKLLPEETPRYLQADTINPYISKLIQHIMDQGAYQYIATLAEEPLIWEMSDPEVLINVILATQKIYGDEAAVNFTEGPVAFIQRSVKDDKSALLLLHLQLYLGWIRNLLDNGDIINGWQAYNRAILRVDESPDLHLLAVELALAERNWARAENLLYQREYPAKLREKSMLLADQISELKGQENKIVIRFQPGSRVIPVKLSVNDQIEHDFLVDTGASFVTIPYSTVSSLGLEDKMSRHQQEVQTAGGPVLANAVTLASMELQGWVVTDVKALVIDLPDRPGLGLLGLNFLSNFRFNLQADEGIFTLEPK